MPPERVIDVMALRGDSIDDVPGAPGIGDKGSVELIQRFGSVEAAIGRAAEIERKTYRESLQNNRDMVLLSKELVTIKTDVDVEFDPSKMEAQPPDPDAARALFTELEFNTLVQDFLTESVELGETDYREATATKDVEALVREVRKDPASILAIALESGGELVTEVAEEEAEQEADKQLSLTAAVETVATPQQLRLAISAKQGSALSLHSR